MAVVSSDLSRVSFIVLRETRRPIMALIIVYAISILGMIFIPGIKIEGEVQYMSIFHAFYFMTYTATTTGFGEIPIEFSNAQRFWAIICLYSSVITWFYAVGSIIRLFQNVFFLRAVAEWQFLRNVKRINAPFFIICGFGDTGSVLARGVSDSGLRAVVIDNNSERIQALKLRNYRRQIPGLCADASMPKHLLEAGLERNECQGVVAITNNEEVNLKISAMARLLNPNVSIITMSKVEVFEETLATLGGEVHIVDPFKTFAKVLAASIQHPGFYMLNNWLVGDKLTASLSLDNYIQPPRGTWVICGFGRMGHEVNGVLSKYGIKTAVIDPHNKGNEESIDDYIVGRTTAKTLTQAGIEQASGIIAGTDDDGHNLGILLNARYFNKELFTIVRQNRHENQVAFRSANSNMVMQPSLVTARRILLLMIAPLLKPFFRYLLDDKEGRSEEMEAVIERLKQKIGDKPPQLITINFTAENSQAVIQCIDEGGTVYLGDLLKVPHHASRRLELVVFVIKSGHKEYILPSDDYEVQKNDQLLFCGTRLAVRLFNATINNEYKLSYVQNGVSKPRGIVAQWYVKMGGSIGGKEAG